MPPQLTGRVPFNPLTLLLSLFFGLMMFILMAGLALIGLVMLAVTRILGLFGVKIGPTILRRPAGGAGVFGPGGLFQQGSFGGARSESPSGPAPRTAEPPSEVSDAEPTGATGAASTAHKPPPGATPGQVSEPGRVIGMQRASDGSWRKS